jgi:hypothetical protein
MDPMLQEIVSSQFGGAPAQPAPGQPAAAQPAAEPPKPAADPSPTPIEKASKAGEPASPNDESAFEYIEIDDDDGSKRQLTRQQIKSTFGRYRDLNHKWQSEHAPMKPVLEVTKSIMEQAKKNGYEAKPGEVAELVNAAVRAYISNPQMGQKGGKDGEPEGQKPQAKSEMGEWDDERLSAWEKENAVSLPPGFKDMASGYKSVQQQMAMMAQAIQRLAQGVPQGVQQAQQGAQQMQQEAMNQQAKVAQQAIKNNLAVAMQSNQVAPEQESDFMQFAMIRGYAPEDFIDPELAATVVADYRANKDAPEVSRLREVAKRRQAFTGRIEGAPAGGAAAAPAGGDAMFSAMLDQAMTRR